ncbi:cilia- and flagella-associated protein 20 [Diachasma alloeum]|uniref:cilia- and flagella-associated protein 20 n=1 Tax=Diachasma alloeum TaxID=454923 RepID=UPI0007381B04|nr:cilia- and flagella-associated protein 20 [Diachasma alloeum]
MLHVEGFESLLSSVADRPLSLWGKNVALDGSVKRVEDEALKGDRVIEIIGRTEGSTSRDALPTCIHCPSGSNEFLQTKLPILVFVIKNLKREGKIEFQVTDKLQFRRRFILITNAIREKIPKITPTTAFLPFSLDDGWNMLEIDLRNLCKEVYLTDYISLNRIIIYPNFRVRRIYLQDRHYEQNETPKEIFDTLAEFYKFRKKTIKAVDKNCQTQMLTRKIVQKPIKKKKKKRKSEEETSINS